MLDEHCLKMGNVLLSTEVGAAMLLLTARHMCMHLVSAPYLLFAA
jgi:hypothetical protein